MFEKMLSKIVKTDIEVTDQVVAVEDHDGNNCGEFTVVNTEVTTSVFGIKLPTRRISRVDTSAIDFD